MGQRQKLFDDIVEAIEWMNAQNFRQLMEQIVQENPHLAQRISKELARAEKKQLTQLRNSVTVK